MRSVICALAVGLASFWTSTSAAVAQENDFTKKFSNPIADLISVPFQFNDDGTIDPSDDGWRATLEIQPVIPTLNPERNVISRTILPIPSQWDVHSRHSSKGVRNFS